MVSDTIPNAYFLISNILLYQRHALPNTGDVKTVEPLHINICACAETLSHYCRVTMAFIV